MIDLLLAADVKGPGQEVDQDGVEQPAGLHDADLSPRSRRGLGRGRAQRGQHRSQGEAEAGEG